MAYPHARQAGYVTVSTAQADAQAPDPDILALQQLPPVRQSPNRAPPLGVFLTQPRRPQPCLLAGLAADQGAGAGGARVLAQRRRELPTLDPATLSALGREYAAYCRNAAEPLYEAEDARAEDVRLEALCARILYLLALRFNELSAAPPRCVTCRRSLRGWEPQQLPRQRRPTARAAAAV